MASGYVGSKGMTRRGIEEELELVLERLNSDIGLLTNFKVDILNEFVHQGKRPETAEEEFTEILEAMYGLRNVLIKTVEPWNY